MIFMVLFIILAWIAAGITAAGFFVAYFQGEFTEVAEKGYAEDLGIGLGWGLMYGPLALAFIMFDSRHWRQYGWHLGRRARK